MDWKLELVAIPVSDVDRAKAFYTEKVGFNADHDHSVGDEIRFVAARAELVERGVRSATFRCTTGGRSSSSAIRTETAGPFNNCLLTTNRLHP